VTAISCAIGAAPTTSWIASAAQGPSVEPKGERSKGGNKHGNKEKGCKKDRKEKEVVQGEHRLAMYRGTGRGFKAFAKREGRFRFFVSL
jgi:hypothetical protein